jgi:hypothetical protein
MYAICNIDKFCKSVQLGGQIICFQVFVAVTLTQITKQVLMNKLNKSPANFFYAVGITQ